MRVDVVVINAWKRKKMVQVCVIWWGFVAPEPPKAKICRVAPFLSHGEKYALWVYLTMHLIGIIVGVVIYFWGFWAMIFLDLVDMPNR